MIDLRFSTALQMVLGVALADKDDFRCTSRTLAEGLGTNASFVRKLLIPLTREGMIVVAIGKGGGLHLGRAAEQITLRDLYLAVMGDKRILVAREDIPSRCSITVHTRRHLPRRIWRLRVFHRPEDQVLHRLLSRPIGRNAGLELRTATVSALLVNDDEMPKSGDGRFVDVELGLALILLAERRAEKLEFRNVAHANPP